MFDTTNVSAGKPFRKPIMMIAGTCGGCKGFPLEANQTELANVQCVKKESSYLGKATGFLGMVDCGTYEKRDTAPEGFNFI